MKSILETIGERNSPLHINPDEYINDADGLIYCSACNTPRQFRLPIKDGLKSICLPTMCRCLREKRDAEEAESEARQFTETVARLRSIGLTSRALHSCTFDNDDGSVDQIKIARKFADNFEKFEAHGEGLLLWGRTGSGKTYMAACVANALIDRGISVFMTNFSRILSKATSGISDDRSQLVDDLNRFRLMIIDDLGIERNTSFAAEQVFSVIDHRCNSRKPMIITTNLMLDQMKNADDVSHARIYERILERCLPVMVSGSNVRRRKADENYHELKKLLWE